MSFRLDSLKGLYRDYIGEHCRFVNGDTRSLDYGSLRLCQKNSCFDLRAFARLLRVFFVEVEALGVRAYVLVSRDRWLLLTA